MINNEDIKNIFSFFFCFYFNSIKCFIVFLILPLCYFHYFLKFTTASSLLCTDYTWESAFPFLTLSSFSDKNSYKIAPSALSENCEFIPSSPSYIKCLLRKNKSAFFVSKEADKRVENFGEVFQHRRANKMYSRNSVTKDKNLVKKEKFFLSEEKHKGIYNDERKTKISLTQVLVQSSVADLSKCPFFSLPSFSEIYPEYLALLKDFSVVCNESAQKTIIYAKEKIKNMDILLNKEKVISSFPDEAEQIFEFSSKLYKNEILNKFPSFKIVLENFNPSPCSLSNVSHVFNDTNNSLFSSPENVSNSSSVQNKQFDTIPPPDICNILVKIYMSIEEKMEEDIDRLLNIKFKMMCEIKKKDMIENILKNADKRLKGKTESNLDDEVHEIEEEELEKFEYELHKLIPIRRRRAMNESNVNKNETESKPINKKESCNDTRKEAFFLESKRKENLKFKDPVEIDIWCIKHIVHSAKQLVKLLLEEKKKKIKDENSYINQQNSLVKALQTQNEHLNTLQNFIQSKNYQTPETEGVDGLAGGIANPIINLLINTLKCGLAYRPPNSNLNLSFGYNNRKTSIQVSCVPDESSHLLLGNNGFVNGVMPGNLGISLNMNI